MICSKFGGEESMREMLSSRGAKGAGLAAAVLLALTGGQGTALGEARTYDYLNEYTDSAEAGDPITVSHLGGWSAGKEVSVGTADTGSVTIHDFSGSGGAGITVRGRDIAFTNEQGGFWNGGAALSVGDESTQKVTFKTLAGQGGSTAVRGTEENLGSINIGDEGSLTAGSTDTASVTTGNISLYRSGYTGGGGTAKIDGRTITVGTAAEGGIVSLSGKSTLELGTEAMTGGLHLQKVDVSGGSAATIGNSGAGDITIDNFGVEQPARDPDGKITLSRAAVSGNTLSIGGNTMALSDADVTLTARGDVNAGWGLVITGTNLRGTGQTASLTVDAGGDVTLGEPGGITYNPSIGAVGGQAKVAVSAGGRLQTGSGVLVTGNGSVSVRAAAVEIGGAIHATGSNAGIRIDAEAPDGTKGTVTAQSAQVDNDGTLSMTADSITLAPQTAGPGTGTRSLHVTDCDVTLDANSIDLPSGVQFTGTSEVKLAARDRLVIGNKYLSGDTAAVRITLGDYGSSETGRFYAGGTEADAVINGTFAITGSSNEAEEAWVDGRDVTLNASRQPSLEDSYSERYSAAAVIANSAGFRAGNAETTETTVVNGHVYSGGSGETAFHGRKAVTVSGLKGNFESNGNAFSLFDEGGSTIRVGDDGTAQTTVNGEIVTGKDTVLAVAGQNVLLDNAGNTALYANAASKAITIGTSGADSTTVKGRILVNSPGSLKVAGREITLSDGAAPDSGTLGMTVKTGYDGSQSAADSSTHDVLVIQQAADDAVTIGETDSHVSIDGRLVGLNGGFTVAGDTIHIYEGSNRDQNLVISTAGAVNLGSEDTDTLQIDGGLWARSGNTTAMTAKGAHILIDPAGGMRAIQATDKPVAIGTDATETAVIDGEIWSDNKQSPVTVSGRNVSLDHNGSTYAAYATYGGTIALGTAESALTRVTGKLTARGGAAITLDGQQYRLDADGSAAAAETLEGGSVTVGHAGSAGRIDGNLVNAKDGRMEVWLDGSSSALNGTTADAGLTAAGGTSGGALTLHLNGGAVWNLDGDASVSSLAADGGVIRFNEDTADQKLYAGDFAGDGAAVTLGHAGNAAVNDHIYVRGTHTGATQLLLHARSGAWTDGAIGSVLASVGTEQGSFFLPEQENRLFFHKVVLDTHEKERGDTVTEGYNTDWYIKGFAKRAVDDQGSHTHFVRSMLGLQGMNYQLWREDMDSLFKRLGDLHSQAAPPDGVWARVQGIRSERSGGEGAFNIQHHQYQVGYDRLLGENSRERHYQGIALGYSRGRGNFSGGTADLSGISLGLYDTHVEKDGQYWDFTLKGQHISDEVYGSYGAKGTLDNNGFTAGAEYGWKRQSAAGWFAEPQAQFTLGWLKGASADLANGVHYGENDIHSAVGRIGFRAGYEGPRAQIFAKANWFHEFGGSGQMRFRDDEGSLSVAADYGDSWFEYGIGMAVQLSPASQFYLDAEKSSTGTYHKKWGWNAGIRWTF